MDLISEEGKLVSTHLIGYCFLKQEGTDGATLLACTIVLSNDKVSVPYAEGSAADFA